MARVLFVDRCQLLHEIVRRALPEHEVVPVRTVNEAIGEILRQEPALVLIDLSLPSSGALTLFNLIREYVGGIPVFGSLASGSSSHAEIPMGLAGILVKESPTATFVQSLRSLLSQTLPALSKPGGQASR